MFQTILYARSIGKNVKLATIGDDTRENSVGASCVRVRLVVVLEKVRVRLKRRLLKLQNLGRISRIFYLFGFSDAILQMKLFFRLKGRLLKFRNFMAPF